MTRPAGASGEWSARLSQDPNLIPPVRFGVSQPGVRHSYEWWDGLADTDLLAKRNLVTGRLARRKLVRSGQLPENAMTGTVKPLRRWETPQRVHERRQLRH